MILLGLCFKKKRTSQNGGELEAEKDSGPVLKEKIHVYTILYKQKTQI